MALVLINLGDVARERGEEERACDMYNEAIDPTRGTVKRERRTSGAGASCAAPVTRADPRITGSFTEVLGKGCPRKLVFDIVNRSGHGLPWPLWR
jgi:hypothetical protein